MKTKKLICLLFTLILATSVLFGCTPTTSTSDSGDDEKIAEREYSNKAQVIILLGQSNASGCSNTAYLYNYFDSKKMNEYVNKGYENVKMSYIADGNTSLDQFVPVKTGLANTESRFGPEIGIAEKISELDPTDRVFIIKYAAGGTRLTNQWTPPSIGGESSTGYLYSGAKYYILKQLAALQEMGLKPKVKAICWMQGESDADADAPYASYENYERAFINDLRGDLSAYKPKGKKIGFVDAGISDSTPWVHYAEINAAKKALSDADPVNHIYLDTIGAKLTYNLEPSGQADLYHYDSNSMIKLGHMFAEALLNNFIDA